MEGQYSADDLKLNCDVKLMTSPGIRVRDVNYLSVQRTAHL